MSPTDLLALLAVALFIVGVVLGFAAGLAWLAEPCEQAWDDDAGMSERALQEQPPA